MNYSTITGNGIVQDVTTAMNLDILLENVQRKIEMKTKQDILMG